MSEPKPIKLFRSGRFTATNGNAYDYSEGDLAAIAAAYDPASDPAPLVVGHPKMDHPAFGWVKSLDVQDGHLIAHPDPAKLEPAFAEAVNAGRFSKVSASFYAPDDPNNPKPGGWYLKHVGFLGAAAPSLKGLGTVAFAEGDALITLETETTQEPPKVDDRTAEFAERDTALTARETALQERERQLAEREAAGRHENNVAFAEVMVNGGKLAPAGKDLVVGVLDALGTEAVSKSVNFGEGNGELAPAAAFKKLLEGAGTVVDFSERAADAGGGKGADEDPSAIASKAVSFMESEKAAGRNITHAAAVRHVMKDQAA